MVNSSKITPQFLSQIKQQGKHFACVTSYDTPSTQLIEAAGIEVALVGDSLGMVLSGRENTQEVTVEEMLYHTRAASKSAEKSLLVADLPYEASQKSVPEIIKIAKSFQEAGADAVKIEGPVFDVIKGMVAANVPVMAHLGLTPQSVSDRKDLKVQAKEPEEARQLLNDAKEIQEVGAFAVVLECVPARLADKVTRSLSIPTIGIGAGPFCDGQILVWHDLLGWNPDTKFKFVRQYMNFGEQAVAALKDYRRDVASGNFPNHDESFQMQVEKIPAL